MLGSDKQALMIFQKLFGALQKYTTTYSPLCPHLHTFVFLWFALGRNLFLFQGLSLGVLSPATQLKVDKFPHHEGLCKADGSQDGYPCGKKQHICNSKGKLIKAMEEQL